MGYKIKFYEFPYPQKNKNAKDTMRFKNKWKWLTPRDVLKH